MLMYNLKLKLGRWNSVTHQGTPEVCVIDFGNFDSFSKCQQFYKKFVDSAVITFPDGSPVMRFCVITPIVEQSDKEQIPF